MDDDPIMRVAIYVLVASVFVVILDAFLGSYELPGGFWGVPAGAFAFLTAAATARARNGKNGKNGKDGR